MLTEDTRVARDNSRIVVVHVADRIQYCRWRVVREVAVTMLRRMASVDRKAVPLMYVRLPNGGFISVSMARRLLCSFTLRVGVKVSARYREALSLHYSDVLVETMSDFTGV